MYFIIINHSFIIAFVFYLETLETFSITLLQKNGSPFTVMVSCYLKTYKKWTSVVQWSRICLQWEGTQAITWEIPHAVHQLSLASQLQSPCAWSPDSTTRSHCNHSYRAQVTGARTHKIREAPAITATGPVRPGARTPQQEKHCNE